MLKLRKLLIALSMIAGACSITNIAAAATEAEVATPAVAEAVTALKQALSAADTQDAVDAAKSAAVVAGVPAADVNRLAAPFEQAIAAARATINSVETDQSTMGGSDLSQKAGIITSSQELSNTGSTYNQPGPL